MLKDKNSSAIAAVKKIGPARDFYEHTLGLEIAGDHAEDGVVVYRTGKTQLTVYESEFAGTNKANAVTWAVGGEFDAIIADLRNKGVAFEEYDIEGVENDGGVHRAGGMKLVWFKDPDGNILHILSA